MITNINDFKSYCLRRLGAPVITINVADEQVDDRIYDAIQLFYEQHYDGVTREYYKYQIQQTDKDNQYFTVPPNLVGVSRIFPLDAGAGRIGDIFDIRYQFALNDLYALTAVDLVPYYMTMTHLNVINELLVGQTPYRFNKNTNRVYLDTDWNKFNAGDYIVIEAMMTIDPDAFSQMFNDRWLQKYATALIKQQWAQNISKFAGAALPGGITLNGPQMMMEAKQEIQEAEEELRDRYTLPPLDFMG